jgi:uncharacterized protein (DUF1330 family)
MPKAYWLPHLDVSNPEAYKAYQAAAAIAHDKHGGKLLVRPGRAEFPEGKLRSRSVMREFASYDDAIACYRSPEYARARPLRQPHSVADLVVVEGYDGPQPAPVGTPPAPTPLKGYWIAHADPAGPDGYKAYAAATALPFGMFGARFLVRGGRQEVPEGHVRVRSVVLEFPSFEAALACYRSPEYQSAVRLREGKGVMDLVIIEQWDGASH